MQDDSMLQSGDCRAQESKEKIREACEDAAMEAGGKKMWYGNVSFNVNEPDKIFDERS